MPGKDPSSANPNVLQMTRIRKLYELQLVDTQIARLEVALGALDDGTAMRAQVEQARSAEETARAELQARQSRLRDLELELQSTVGKATRVEQDLYSGRISNPKELRAMQEDVEALGRQRQRIEDEMLGLMEEVERQLEQIRALEAARQARERELDEHLEEYTTRQRALTAELEAGRQQRGGPAGGGGPGFPRRKDRPRRPEGRGARTGGGGAGL